MQLYSILFITELTRISRMDGGGGGKSRFSSEGEKAYLERLVRKYGKDIEGMARDRKLNVDQRTSGQLRRSIEKAGGFVAFAS
jgi:nucleolar protein 16